MTLSTAKNIAPAQIVHKFFSEMGLPYRAYSAEDPEALREAITEVSTLQNLPIRYSDIVPKQDLSNRCYGVALILSLLMLVAKIVEIRVWH
jgi:mxaC protein